MKSCRNDEAAVVFDSLADHQAVYLQSIRQMAQQAGADTDAAVDELWFDQELNGDLAREIADNPYLMTPYRALQLAVNNSERMFEILSTLAAEQKNQDISGYAELLARGQLSQTAALRLRRRSASRSEIKTAITKAGLDEPPVEVENFKIIVQTVHAIVRAMMEIVREAWAVEITPETDQVFQGLLEDFQDYSQDLPKADRAALESKVRAENDNLFAGLKTLLRELESAADLFLGYAETAQSEDVVRAAQAKAQRYVRRIAKIRDELKLRVE